jgi:KaiC/GvpD/RAD55 family RecA-like ATPase
MNRIPFGVSQLDQRIGGGMPPGSVVLLAGEAGAGAREFCYTSAVMNGLGIAEPDTFDLQYGSLRGSAALPEEIHYVSFTASRDDLTEEMAFTIEEDLVAGGLEAVSFTDLSPEYFQMSPVPQEWYAGTHATLAELGNDTERDNPVAAVAAYIEEHAADNLIIVDSLTDLIGLREEAGVAWDDVIYLLKGLRKAARDWRGAVLLLVSSDTLSEERLGDLMSSVDGTMSFEWASGGNDLSRTLIVREFRGVLSRLEEEEIVRFETEIHEAGYDITNVRKIR